MSKHLNYDKVRATIKDGDVLLYKGKGILSWFIKKLSRSEYSHSGIVAWWNDRLIVMEAIRKGVVVTSLSRNVAHYHGDVEWRTTKKRIPEHRRLAMVRFAQKQLGKEYNFLELIVMGTKIILMKLLNLVLVRLGKEKRIFEDERVICSQFVAETYESIGITIETKVAPPFIAPADIANSKLFKFKGALKKHV
jgi:hypothetical protein